MISRDNPELDNGWLCDRGRFNYRYVHSEERIRQPLLRKRRQVCPGLVGRGIGGDRSQLRTLRRDHGGEAIGAIGGGRLSNEEAYLFQKAGPGRLRHAQRRLAQRASSTWPPAPSFPVGSPTSAGLSGILLVDVLPAERIPVIDLRIRRAAERGQAVLAAVGPAMPKYRPAFKAFPALESGDSQVLASQELMSCIRATGGWSLSGAAAIPRWARRWSAFCAA